MEVVKQMEREGGLTELEQKKIKRDLDKLPTVMKKVEYLIERFPESRKNNNLLCVLFWKYAERARTLGEVVHLTKADNLIRTRQLVEKRWRERKG